MRVLCVGWDPEIMERVGPEIRTVGIDAEVLHHNTDKHATPALKLIKLISTQIVEEDIRYTSLTRLVATVLMSGAHYDAFVISTDYGYRGAHEGLRLIRSYVKYLFTPTIIIDCSSREELRLIQKMAVSAIFLPCDAKEIASFLLKQAA